MEVQLIFFRIVHAVLSQIIADHTIIDTYGLVPQQYIDTIKAWLVDLAGESHSRGYRTRMNLLAALNLKFAVQIFEGIFRQQQVLCLESGDMTQ